MKQVTLPTSGRKTSQLGFGCAFPNHFEEKQVDRVLSAAYDAGIRHFDVAPFYLDGRSEQYLGKFLSDRKDATVTTKYGLRPPSRLPAHIKGARAVLGPVARLVRNRKAGGPPSPFGLVPKTAKAPFTPGDIKRSLAESLASLRAPYVDLLLFHEADRGDLEQAGVLRAVDEHLAAGQVGGLGVAGEVTRVASTITSLPDSCRITQFDWDAISKGPRFEDRFEILFRVFTRKPKDALGSMSERFGSIEKASRELGADLLDQSIVRTLLLRAALISNPEGITLITSTNPHHIMENVEVAADTSLDEPSRKLLDLA